MIEANFNTKGPLKIKKLVLSKDRNLKSLNMMYQKSSQKKTNGPIKIMLLIGSMMCAIWVTAQSDPEITNLGSAINSDKIEYAPSISADGNTMIYQSNKEGNYELFMAHRDPSGAWSSSEVIESIKNFGSADVLIAGSSLSYDGNYIYFFALKFTTL